MGPIILCACLLLQASSIQTDWTGGPGVTGPVSDFGFAFYSSDSVSYASSGMIIPVVTSHSSITDWTEHVVENNWNIDGHGALRPADFDADGDFDLAGAIRGLDVIRLYRNDLVETGVDTFVPQTDLPVSVHKYYITWVGDFDDDGRPDVVVPGDSMFWFKNNGNWNFTKNYIGYWDHRGDINACDVGDVDNDGDLDIVAGIRPLLLWRNNGDMTFVPESITEGRFWRAKLGDLNNDSYLDLLATDQVYLNPGPSNPGVFSDPPDWDAGFPDGAIDGNWIADFDGDNIRDLLLCSQWPNTGLAPAIYWYENDGNGASYTPHEIVTGRMAKAHGDAAIAEDMDLDGRTDVVGGYSRIGYFHQYPLGEFTLVTVDPSFGGSGGCHWVDVENLGRQPGGIKFTKDIMASGTGQFHWWENGLDEAFSRNAWLVSSILDAGSPSDWQWFVWQANRPAGTELDFYVRTGTTAGQCTLNIWQGPFSVTTGIEVDSVDIGPYTTPGDRYFQYRVFMAGYNEVQPCLAPVAYEVRVVFDNDIPDVHDVGATAILAPVGTLDSGTVVTPQAVVHNYGTLTETFPVTFRIGSVYDQTVQWTLDVGETETVDFPSWTANTLGGFETKCTTMLDNDMDNTNDRQTDSVFVKKFDVGVVSIVIPSGHYLLGGEIRPEAVWHNYGGVEADFEAWMILEDTTTDSRVYSEKVDVTGLDPDQDTAVSSFPSCVLSTEGPWQVRCSTYAVGDMNQANDVLDQEFTVGGSPDIGVVGIIAPAGRVDTSQVVVPEALVRNYGDVSVPFRAWFIMNDPAELEVYREYVDVAWLAAGFDTALTFPDFNVGLSCGEWTTRCSVYVAGDVQPGNDWANDLFTVKPWPSWPYGWVEIASVPLHPSDKPVRRGGWLAFNNEEGHIYGAKGYKTQDFYRYDPMANFWIERAKIPLGEEGKPPRKGAKGVCDGGKYIYMTKGNNTLGFWRYDIRGDSWNQLPDVPLGRFRKKVKGGTDLAYVVREDPDYVYLLKGYKTEFYRYNVDAARWDTLPEAPTGRRGKWDKGSWLVLDKEGRQFLYAHKAKYHELWQYDLRADTWYVDSLDGMPYFGMHGGRLRRKKSKDGGSADWYDGRIFALKGGNCGQYFHYDIAGNSWVEREPLPDEGTTGKKRVKYGADFVTYGYGAFFALKGNKTCEFWRYMMAPEGPAARPERYGAMARRGLRISDFGFWICPNPLAGGFARLSYVLPKPGPVNISIYDIAGRAVKRIRVTPCAAQGCHPIDLRSLSAGVYLVRLEAGGLSFTRKLVVK